MTVFIYDFFPLDEPFERSLERLLDPSSPVLADAAAATFGEDAPGTLHAGVPRRRSDAVVVPVTWSAERAGPPFDHLEGDLQLAQLSEGHSHLSLSATCSRGADGDRPRTQRLAEARVRRFLHLVAAALERPDERSA